MAISFHWGAVNGLLWGFILAVIRDHVRMFFRIPCLQTARIEERAGIYHQAES